MSQVLSLTEALDLLENGAWHTVAYVSADRNKKEGGRIIRIPECTIVSGRNQHVSKSITNASDRNRKRPHHSEHATRNLTLPNGLTRKMHIHLLFAVNNYRVL